jgi:hypothetical protein
LSSTTVPITARVVRPAPGQRAVAEKARSSQPGGSSLAELVFRLKAEGER